jgi:hypothetical protein
MTTLWRSSLPVAAPENVGRRGIARHLGLLAVALLALAPLVIARTLHADPHGLGTHTQLGLEPCTLLQSTGLPCATCGMTTAFAYAVHGQLVRAFLTQPLGALLAVGCAAVALMSLYALVSGADLGPLQRRLVRPAGVVIFAILLLGAWGFKIVVFLAGPTMP